MILSVPQDTLHVLPEGSAANGDQEIRDVRISTGMRSLLIMIRFEHGIHHLMRRIGHSLGVPFALEVAVHTVTVHPSHAHPAPDGPLTLPLAFPFVDHLQCEVPSTNDSKPFPFLLAQN